MLRVLNSCKSWTKGEQAKRACMVALRKHKFPELIRPRGCRSLTCVTACPLGAFLKSLLNNFDEESSPLPILNSLFKLSASDASRLKFVNWFSVPFSLIDVTEHTLFSLTWFALVILAGLGKKLAMLPFCFRIADSSGKLALTPFSPLSFRESGRGALSGAFGDFGRLLDSTVTELREPNCSWFFCTGFSFFPDDFFTRNDFVSSSVNEPNSSTCSQTQKQKLAFQHSNNVLKDVWNLNISKTNQQ